jgi:hypothetical protein
MNLVNPVNPVNGLVEIESSIPLTFRDHLTSSTYSFGLKQRPSRGNKEEEERGQREGRERQGRQTK